MSESNIWGRVTIDIADDLLSQLGWGEGRATLGGSSETADENAQLVGLIVPPHGRLEYIGHRTEQGWTGHVIHRFHYFHPALPQNLSEESANVAITNDLSTSRITQWVMEVPNVNGVEQRFEFTAAPTLAELDKFSRQRFMDDLADKSLPVEM